MADPDEIEDMDEHELEQRRREERRAVDEGGGGESEGFELAEQDLIEHASHGDMHNTMPIMRDAAHDNAPDRDGYGEPDEEIKPDLD
ncbi:MAG: hypothetical protein ACYDC2_04320 [Solirubrobacteraceae bacterium]